MTYTFTTLDGHHLATLATSDPFAEVGELAVSHNVDADEIQWQPALDGARGIRRLNGFCYWETQAGQLRATPSAWKAAGGGAADGVIWFDDGLPADMSDIEFCMAMGWVGA